MLQGCVFPRTGSLTDEASVNLEYDGSAEGLCAATAKAARHVELRALCAAKTITGVLEIMLHPEVFEALYLDSADAVVLQLTGKHVLRIKNTRSSGPSGRSVLLEISGVRIRATMELQAFKAQVFDVTVPFAFGLLAVGVLAAYSLMLALKKQR